MLIIKQEIERAWHVCTLGGIFPQYGAGRDLWFKTPTSPNAPLCTAGWRNKKISGARPRRNFAKTGIPKSAFWMSAFSTI